MQVLAISLPSTGYFDMLSTGQDRSLGTRSKILQEVPGPVQKMKGGIKK